MTWRDAIDVLIAELDVDYDVTAPLSEGQQLIGTVVIKRGRVVALHRR